VAADCYLVRVHSRCPPLPPLSRLTLTCTVNDKERDKALR